MDEVKDEAEGASRPDSSFEIIKGPKRAGLWLVGKVYESLPEAATDRDMINIEADELAAGIRSTLLEELTVDKLTAAIEEARS